MPDGGKLRQAGLNRKWAILAEEKTQVPEISQEIDIAAAQRPHGAIQTLADVTMAPVAEVLGHARWLRAAIMLHLLSTISTTIIGWHAGFASWQLYSWMGLFLVILVGNFMRWRQSVGLFRRFVATLCAVGVCGLWSLLLLDRARGVIGNNYADYSPAFWLPTVMQWLCAGLLIAHFVSMQAHRRKRGQALE